jgi:hypothetical protein
MGGRISAPSELPNIWVFDPITGVYTDTGADMIEDVSNYDADLILDDGAGLGPAVYVIGGTNKDGGGANIGMVQRYYPQLNYIEALPSDDNWPGKVNNITVGGMGTTVVDDIIYVFGGWQSQSSPYFYDGTWAFDPKQPQGSRWTDLGVALTPGRSYIQTAVQNGKIYAMGGIWDYFGGDLVPTDVVEVLDTSDPGAGWTTLAPLPTATAEGRGFGFDDDTRAIQSPWPDKLYLVGGGDWPDITRDVFEYDIATDTWDDTFPELNDRRVNLAGVFVPICSSIPDDGLPGMWVFGGRSENGCDPPYGATEFYPFPCDCLGVTDAAISGPEQMLPDETGLFTVSWNPPTATIPVDVTWSNGLTDTTAAYSWSDPGIYTVAVTVTNCAGSSVVTATQQVEVLCVGLSGAAITGPEELKAGETGAYSVTLTPPTATLPVDILWSNGLTGTSAFYSWSDPGAYTVTVTATNCAGSAVVTDAFDVSIRPYTVLLPVLLKN